MVSTVAELRRSHVVNLDTLVVHWNRCPRATHLHRAPVMPIVGVAAYWEGRTRPGRCCFPIVPTPDAPDDAPGYLHAMTDGPR